MNRTLLLLTLLTPVAVAADPCSNAPDPGLCQMQLRAQGVIENLTAQTPLYQEGVFVRIEQNQRAERARELAAQQNAADDARKAQAAAGAAIAQASAERALRQELREERSTRALEKSARANRAMAISSAFKR